MTAKASRPSARLGEVESFIDVHNPRRSKQDLIVKIDHRAGDFLYPILVDPYWIDRMGSTGNPTYRDGRIRRLGAYGSSPGALIFVASQTPRLTGRFVSFLEYSRPLASSTSNTALVEIDLRTGRRGFDSGGALAPDDGDKPGNRVYAWVGKSNGSLAFILSEPGGVETVRRFDATGYQVLDSGAINETFLELSRDRRHMTWKLSDGTRRSAPIR